MSNVYVTVRELGSSDAPALIHLPAGTTVYEALTRYLNKTNVDQKKITINGAAAGLQSILQDNDNVLVAKGTVNG